MQQPFDGISHTNLTSGCHSSYWQLATTISGGIKKLENCSNEKPSMNGIVHFVIYSQPVE
jgi:hypothetical protein